MVAPAALSVALHLVPNASRIISLPALRRRPPAPDLAEAPCISFQRGLVVPCQLYLAASSREQPLVHLQDPSLPQLFKPKDPIAS